MENYAKIENEVVVNAIIADADFAEQNGYVLMPDGVAIGWRYIDGEFLPPLPTDYAQQNKAKAEQLLQSSDWVELPSVSNPANTPHLVNVNEFLAYRSALRSIAVNPPSEPAVFPAKPEESWSSV